MRAFIEVDGLRMRAFHGIGSQERTIGNVFEVSLKLEYPGAVRAMSSDRVVDTINYTRVVEIVRDAMAMPSDLIEHVVGRIHSAVLTEYPNITGGYITVSKLAPPIPVEMTAARFTIEF